MSAASTLDKTTSYAEAATGGPTEFAADGSIDSGGSGSPVKRPGLLLRATLVLAVLLAAATSFAAEVSGPHIVAAPVKAHLSSTLFEQSIGSGFQQPEQIAVDSSGNLYIADVLTNNVYKETLIGGIYTQSILRTNLGGPVGVAVDSTGNVYIADSDNSRVLKETLEPSGTYGESVVPTSGLGGIVFDLAVDKKGNLYIADALNNRVVKETVSGNSYTQSVIPATGLLSPVGVAVDAGGNLYIADSFNNRIVKETISGGTYTQSVIIPPVLPLGPAGVNAPQQIWLVGTTLYIADTLNSRIAKATYNGTTKTYTLSTVATGSLNAPTGVAVDSYGDLFIADTNNKRVIEEAPGSGSNFGGVPVGTTSQAATLTFTFDNGGKIGAPVIASYVGGTGTFNNASGTTCTKGSTFATGKTCTIQVTFKPSSPGFAYGEAELNDGSNHLLASGDLTGTGIGTRVFYPNNAIDFKIGSGLKSSASVAIDLSGNVYIADTGNNQVLKEAPAGSSSYTQSTVVKSLKGPNSVGVDTAGDVFIVDEGNKRVIEETPASGGTYTQTVVYAAATHSTEEIGPLVVDLDGHVWVVFPGEIQEFSLVSGTWIKESKIAVEVPASHGTLVPITPISLAIDLLGNFYVGEASGDGIEQRVVRYTSDGAGGYSELVAEQGTYPKAIAVDRIGNLFLTDNGNSIHVFVPSTTGQHSGTQSTGYYVETNLATQSQLSEPAGLAVDGNEVVYIANVGSSQVLHESWSSAPAFDFPNTVVDQTSGAIVQSILNVGNAVIDFVVPTTGQNPTLSTAYILNTGETDACPVLTASSEPESLNPGSECSTSVSFSPTAVANFLGSLTYLANVGSHSQFGFNLNGRGIATIPTITWPAPASIAYGTPLSATQLNATASYNGQTVPGTFAYNPALGAVLSAGTQTLSVQFTPSVSGYSSASASVTITVTKVPLMIVADSFSRPYGSPNPTFTASYIGFVNGDSPALLDGYLTFSTEATQQFPWGYYPITVTNPVAATQTNYDVTYVDGTLVITQVALTVTAQDVTVTNSSDIPSPYPCAITGFVNGDTAAVVSGACDTNAQNYSNSPSGAYTVTPTIGTFSAINYTFTNFVNGTLTISESQAKPVKHRPAAAARTASDARRTTSAVRRRR
jgi:sugar lactone lactonase YvrE